MLASQIGLIDPGQDDPWSNPTSIADTDRDCFEGVAP
jgi:hypothetical protein